MDLHTPYNLEENKYFPFTAKEMDITTGNFGLRFVKGGNPEGLIELYIEDDDNYFYKCSFNHYWLYDLINGLGKAIKLFND